jgi:hypothetical protein
MDYPVVLTYPSPSQRLQYIVHSLQQKTCGNYISECFAKIFDVQQFPDSSYQQWESVFRQVECQDLLSLLECDGLDRHYQVSLLDEDIYESVYPERTENATNFLHEYSKVKTLRLIKVNAGSFPTEHFNVLLCLKVAVIVSRGCSFRDLKQFMASIHYAMMCSDRYVFSIVLHRT